MNFGYALAVGNLTLYEKNCDWILDSFYRDASKSWIVVIHVPLSINLCNNTNAITRTVSITSF